MITTREFNSKGSKKGVHPPWLSLEMEKMLRIWNTIFFFFFLSVISSEQRDRAANLVSPSNDVRFKIITFRPINICKISS